MKYQYKTREGTTQWVYSYTQEERQEALNLSLTSLAVSLGYTPVQTGSHYHLKEMDSLVIYNDRTWNRWSGKGNITGGTTIDFMMAFGDASNAAEAINKLLELNGKDIVVKSDNHKAEYQDKQELHRPVFALPPKNKNYKRLYAYLMQTRGLSQDVISEFVHRRLIYEDSVHHNIVFCGMDPDGNIRYAGLRGTADIYGKKFKMDVPGNDKNYGVNIVNPRSDVLKVFESVIDCMSYIDLTGDTTSNKLILGMVEDNPLMQFIKDYNHIRYIVFCLDNDEAGQKAIYGKDGRIGLKEKYEQLGFSVLVDKPELGKDFNECLLLKKKQVNEVTVVAEQDSEVSENIYIHKRGR